MSPRVFKQTGSRVYRGRFRLGNDPKIFDVPLHTEIKEVAEAKLRQLVREKEEELAGIARPKPLVDAARKPLLVHLADYAADVAAQLFAKARRPGTESDCTALRPMRLGSVGGRKFGLVQRLAFAPIAVAEDSQ